MTRVTRSSAASGLAAFKQTKLDVFRNSSKGKPTPKLAPVKLAPLKSTLSHSPNPVLQSPLRDSRSRDLVALDALSTVPPCQRDREIPCRSIEQATLESFIINSLKSGHGSSLYAIGCPGTGKTMTTTNVVVNRLPELCKQNRLSVPGQTIINALSLPSPAALFERMYFQLTKQRASNATSCIRLLDRLFRTRFVVVVIDELDGLLSRSQEVLYHLFEWAHRSDSKLLLIGIANAFELTERFLPRLEMRNITPVKLIFSAYTSEELEAILLDRLSTDCRAMTFKKEAVRLLARKVANGTGDTRKFLDLARQAVVKATQSNFDQVALEHMSAVCQSAFSSMHLRVIQSLPQHQQIILCVASLLLQKETNSSGKVIRATSVQQFHQWYLRVTRKECLPVVGTADFNDIISALESRGVLDLKPNKVFVNRLITMRAPRHEIEFALKDSNFFSSLLKTCQEMSL